MILTNPKQATVHGGCTVACFGFMVPFLLFSWVVKFGDF